MEEGEIISCLEKIKELTNCDLETAKDVFNLVADYCGGNIPDNWRSVEITDLILKCSICGAELYISTEYEDIDIYKEKIVISTFCECGAEIEITLNYKIVKVEITKGVEK
ncbi:hypothetical protein JDFR1000234_31 [uncultured archaeal virus]|jgi:hypothetical protein|uniref:Uncharacterized protein n=1 Tax=uncultured archaeal virus TaxID=1960247 RepID=A0A1S5Y317_9VIRU|nr:hypothetical protein JDFR1000234_31 [uncultured archaeal virus]